MKVRRRHRTSKRWRLVVSGLVLLAAALAVARLWSLRQDSAWVDIVEPQAEAVTATMNSAQVLASLEDVLSKYQSLLQSSGLSKKSVADNLAKLYQTAAADYTNALALENSGGSQAPDSLTQGASLLAASIYERRDSLNNYGEDFSRAQSAQSAQDLEAAVSKIGQAKQNLSK